jgi:hypothetical protein
MGLRHVSSATSVSTLLDMLKRGDCSLLSVAVFAVITVIARFASRRRVKKGDFTTWLRDESSRAVSVS